MKCHCVECNPPDYEKVRDEAFDRGVAFGRAQSAEVAESMSYFATARAIRSGGDEDKLDELALARLRTIQVPTVAMAQAFYLIRRERKRQEELFPGEVLTDGTGPAATELAAVVRAAVDRLNLTPENTFAHVLVEEVLEALAETAPEKLEQELVQVAAVSVKWLEAIERRRREA